MKRQIARLSIIAILLLCILPIACRSDSTPSEATYYVDVDHPQARDSSSHGSVKKPWETLQYAFKQLKPGDTLLIRGGTYTRHGITLTEQNSGREGMPITIKAYPGETALLKNGETIRLCGTDWWTFENLTFGVSENNYIRLGLHKKLGDERTAAADHITIRNCEFRNGKRAGIPIRFANHLLIEGCYFHNIRPGMPWRDAHQEATAISIKYKSDDIVIRNCRFEDIGSDGIQLGVRSHVPGSSIESVSIVGNEFWVNRPYQGILGNVGENGIDIKKVKGPVLVSDNVVHGFRPTTPQQDASGSLGVGIAIHNDAKNVIVERNLLYDNTTHLSIARGAKGTPGGTRDIIVRNNIFRGQRKSGQQGGCALRVSQATNVEVYHNTFYDNEVYIRSRDASGVFKNNVTVGGKPIVNHNSAWDADYNAWIRVEGDVPHRLQGGHELWTDDPMLGSNLRPLSGSPLVNFGQNVGVLDDFNGYLRSDHSPDLGAFEYKGEFKLFLPFVSR